MSEEYINGILFFLQLLGWYKEAVLFSYYQEFSTNIVQYARLK